MERLYIDGERIIDENGGQVILHGLNLVCKDKKLGYVTPCNEELFAWMAEQGFNVIRLGVIWDGVEPEPGMYADDYLVKLKQQVQWAEAHGIYVYLDMHQDLYSVSYGDGAPEWATLSAGLPHITGGGWSDAYLISPALQESADAFWRNDEVDGVGLQDRYAAMWAYVADYFAACGNVIGYDVMNEPYPGSRSQQVMEALLRGYSSIVDKNDNPDIEALAALWISDEGRAKVLERFNDMSFYGDLMELATPIAQEFERDSLIPFYKRVYDAIRTDKSRYAFFLETSYFSNMGMESGIASLSPTAKQIYAPHGYDLVVDTDHYDVYNSARVELIFSAHRKVQKRLNVPVLVGEWGGFTGHAVTASIAKDIMGMFEKYGWSDTYWCWHGGLAKDCCLSSLRRGYPQRIGGRLTEYSYDYDNARLTVRFISDGSETRLYHPVQGIVTRTCPIGEAEITI